MSIDVLTEIVIDRRQADVALYASDPLNAPTWYAHIRSVEWKTPPPMAVGSRVAVVARLLGRPLSYTYEIVELVPDTRLVMRTSEGPFPMETTYTWESVREACTRMTLRNRGRPSRFAKMGAMLMASTIRRANERDLAQLKSLLERGALDPPPFVA